MRVRIMGKYWHLSRGPTPRGWDGYTDPDNKQIVVRPKLSGVRELEVFIHETLHAADLWKHEIWTEPAAEAIAKILWKQGYRKCEPRKRAESGRPHRRTKRRN